MASVTVLRRSHRTASVIYDSNGRDYLASCLGWSVKELETLVQSSKVRPHLQLWYQICILSTNRFKASVDWINNGPNGYFYREGGLQEDLLFACLGEGTVIDPSYQPSLYAAADVVTSIWPTQELWARTAWRIAQSNADDAGVFNKAIISHPAAVYAFVIDLLSIAFHSIAHRNDASIWCEIIIGSGLQESLLSQAGADQDQLLSKSHNSPMESTTESSDTDEDTATDSSDAASMPDSDFEAKCRPVARNIGRKRTQKPSSHGSECGHDRGSCHEKSRRKPDK